MIAAEMTKSIHKQLNQNRVITAFNGEINSNTIVAFLKYIETYFVKETSHQVKRKLWHVLVESLQNIYKHGINKIDNEILNSTVTISKTDNGYLITTCSNVTNNDVDGIKHKIDTINSLSTEALNQLYKSTLQNNTISEKGGAGLGLMELVRKSGNKIEYTLESLQDQYSLLTMNIKVNVI
jgi:flagellar motor component MotA